MQVRLEELGFEPGPVDGNFGNLTRQAVWAFEKLVMGIPRTEATGRVTPELWDRMQDPIQIQPRRPTGGLADHVEIYLPEQVMIIFHGDQPALVTHISSGELDEFGDPAAYCEEATITDRDGVVLEEPIHGISCGESKTPGGVFKIRRFVDGKRVSPLGGMQNPAYFNYGIAIHGAENVPAGARIARLHSGQQLHRRLLPEPARQGRPGPGVERREGAGADHRERVAPVLRPLHPGHDDDVDQHHHDDGAGTDHHQGPAARHDHHGRHHDHHLDDRPPDDRPPDDGSPSRRRRLSGAGAPDRCVADRAR